MDSIVWVCTTKQNNTKQNKLMIALQISMSVILEQLSSLARVESSKHAPIQLEGITALARVVIALMVLCVQISFIFFFYIFLFNFLSLLLFVCLFVVVFFFENEYILMSVKHQEFVQQNSPATTPLEVISVTRALLGLPTIPLNSIALVQKSSSLFALPTFYLFAP